MLCNLRRTSLIYKSFSNTVYRTGSLTALKRYSTNENKDNSEPISEVKEPSSEPVAAAASSTEDKKFFWEVEPKKHKIETPKTVEEATQRQSPATREFIALLDEVFKVTHKGSSPITQPPAEANPPKKKSSSVIERKLLDLVMREKKPYKSKSPLPQRVHARAYDNNNNNNTRDELGSIFDFLNPNANDNPVHSENNKLKEEEMKSIQAIIDSKTDIELLDKVQKEIDREEYHTYYPRVIVKAIEHASQKDPYLALTIFEMVKNKNITSYILGCTTQVYNTLLMMHWNTWGDIYGMLDLMEEMTVNGIEFDNESRRIVRDAVKEIGPEEEKTDSVFWNADEKMYSNIMKTMAGKWEK